MSKQQNRAAALRIAADYRTDIRLVKVWRGANDPKDVVFTAVKRDGKEVGQVFTEHDWFPNMTFGALLGELLGEEPTVKGQRDPRWHDSRAKAMNRKIGDTVL